MADTTRRVRETFGDTREYKRDPKLRRIQRENLRGGLDLFNIDIKAWFKHKFDQLFSADKKKVDNKKEGGDPNELTK